VCLSAGLDGESNTRKISMGSSSSSSSVMAIPSPPPSDSVMKGSTASTQPDKGKSPNRGGHKGSPDDFSKRWLGLRVPSTNRSMGRGRETVAAQEP
jgi:hypothetical protein